MQPDEAEFAAWRERHYLLGCHLNKYKDEIDHLLSMNSDQYV